MSKAALALRGGDPARVRAHPDLARAPVALIWLIPDRRFERLLADAMLTS